MKNVQLVQVSISDYPTIQNMARFYVYDMSRYCGRSPSALDWSCPEDGLYECFDLKPYFVEPDRHAFFIKVGSEKAGFALINKLGSSPDVDWNMGEFFVLAKFQGTGIGEQAVRLLFEQFPGVWERSAMPENTVSIAFIRKTLMRYTGGAFVEKKKISKKPVPHEMVVFRFEAPPKRA
ncbi:MAG: GNAT family N-acetyltransferase [Myxococcaceae bacterium]